MTIIPRRLKLAFASITVGLCSLLFLSTAYADNCDKLDKNQSWVSGFTELNAAYKAEKWDEALKHAKSLEEICDLSPILNYTIARLHKNKGDKEKYLFYLQKSTQNTERFAVDKDTLDRMWEEKYLAAHPEATPEHIASLKADIESLKVDIESLKADLEQAKLTNTELSNTTISKEARLEEQVNDFKTPMWIAVGIGAAGIALTATGAALVATSEPSDFVKKSGVPGRYKENINHTTGWVLLGVGSAFLISGTVFSAILGYKYKHSKDNQSLSFNISPTNASIAFEF